MRAARAACASRLVRGAAGIRLCPLRARPSALGESAFLHGAESSGRFGRRHAGRVSSDAGDPGARIRPARGARGARPSGSGGRDAPAPRLHGLCFRFAVRLCGFLRAPDSQRSARVCEAGSLFHGAPPSPPRSLQDRRFEFARGLLRARALQASASCVTAEPHRTPRAPTPAQRSPRSVFRPQRPVRTRRPAQAPGLHTCVSVGHLPRPPPAGPTLASGGRGTRTPKPAEAVETHLTADAGKAA